MCNGTLFDHEEFDLIVKKFYILFNYNLIVSLFLYKRNYLCCFFFVYVGDKINYILYYDTIKQQYDHGFGLITVTNS